MNTEQYQVVVVGGGTAGVVAALQAARAGMRTCLIEKNSILGGTMTVAGVAWPGLFHAWGRQIIAGIGWELVARCVAEAGMSMPDFSRPPNHHSDHQVRIDPAVFAALCDEALLAAGVDLRFHTLPAAVERADQAWRVTCCGKTGLYGLGADVLVDGTGDANLAQLAGAAVQIRASTQPGTLVCHASGYDPRMLDLEAINAAYTEAVREGRLAATDGGWNAETPGCRGWLMRFGQGANHIYGPNAADSAGKSGLEIEARRAFLRLYRFLRSQPGLENLRIDYLASECGVRESAVIEGHETVSVRDYTSGRVWPDAVCYAFYPIDLHTQEQSGLDCRPLAEGAVPTVPRGALLPKGTPGLVVAGRCLSSDRLANSALRVQATCMATGQAAGALAVCAVRDGRDPFDVPLEEVHALLVEHGAIVPELP